MRFLFLLYNHESGLKKDGGGFRKPWILAEHLVRSGHDVFIISPPVNFESRVRKKIFHVPSLPLMRPLWAYMAQFFLGFLWSLAKRPDIVYFRSSLSFLPALLAVLTGARYCLEINGDAAAESERDGRSFRAKIIRWIERINSQAANRIVVLTQGLSDMVINRYGVRPDKVSVIPSGSDPSHFRPMDPVRCRAFLNLPPDKQVVGFMGVFYRHQGVDALLHAAPHILKAMGNTLFLFVGDGPMRSEWENLASILGVSEACRFVGQIPYDDAPLAVGAMDVAVAPLTENRGEASPLKIFDYLAAGKPVVAHRVASTQNILPNEDILRLVPPGSPTELAEALVALLRDEPLRHELGRKGREAIEKRFNWDAIAGDYIDALAPR